MSKLNEIYREKQSIDTLLGWQGPDLEENGLAVAYISGSNDLAVRGAISADVVGLEHGDYFSFFNHKIFVLEDGDIATEDWSFYVTNTESRLIQMFRGNEHIGDAILFEVKR